MGFVDEIEKKGDIWPLIADEESELHFKPLTCGLGFGKVNEKKKSLLGKRPSKDALLTIMLANH